MVLQYKKPKIVRKRCKRIAKSLISRAGFPSRAVLKAFAKAIARLKLIDEGKATSISQLSEIVGVDRHFVLYTPRLATLSPRIIRSALSGELPDGFSLQKIRKIETDDWEEQERLLGFPMPS